MLSAISYPRPHLWSATDTSHRPHFRPSMPSPLVSTATADTVSDAAAESSITPRLLRPTRSDPRRTSTRPIPGPAGLRAAPPFSHRTSASFRPGDNAQPQPLPQSASSSRDPPAARQRRTQFLRGVRTRRDDRRWTDRTAEIDQLDRAESARERRSEIEAALECAPELTLEEEDEMEEDGGVGLVDGWRRLGGSGGSNNGGSSHGVLSAGPDDEQARLEEIQRLEEMEVEALVDLMASEASGYGSDDEEYDRLFDDMLLETGRSGHPRDVGVSGGGDISQTENEDVDMTG